MVEGYVLNYLLLYISLEIIEVSWQHANTIIGMLSRMYHYYKKSIFLLLLMHPTFYFAILFAMLTNYNTYSLILLFIKTADIATKLMLIKKVFIDKEISAELNVAIFSNIGSFLPYIGVIAYPPLIYMALQF